MFCRQRAFVNINAYRSHGPHVVIYAHRFETT